MPKSLIVAPHLLHFGELRLLALAGACRVMLRFSGWMAAGVQQESLEAFDKFITAGQMRPGSLKVEKLCLHCCIDRLLGAPLVDDFRFKKRMPSRASAVRELLKRGLAAEGFSSAAVGAKSSDYGVAGKAPAGRA
jgi:hypothetical protein